SAVPFHGVTSVSRRVASEWSCVSPLLPAGPGGLGSLDAALALALTLAGAPGDAAASTVLGYRLLTVWLPLIPGLVALGVLIRRRVL
ncbi:lysylphosphatidylglycerol synthase domain-containing protein, partial [Streptomyces aureus]|uniref:lysylphosphatidylglycerol synthase domain-containing protein n=1 Tax=Streptomyces aureus TaxID=193461 RepID=UPI00340130F1